MESWSDQVLNRMKRRYCVGDYTLAIPGILDACPEPFIKNQVMGETEGDFPEPQEVLRVGLFDSTDASAFTRLPKSKAWDMPYWIPDEIIARRYRDLHLISVVRFSIKW